MNLSPFDASDLEEFLIAGKLWKEWIKERESLGVSARENLWICKEDLSALQSAGGAAILKLDGETVANLGSGDGCQGEEVSTSEGTFFINYIWDILKVNEQVVKAMSHSKTAGEVHDFAVVDGHIEVGEGTKILPGVYIEGNAIFGKNCKIGPNCYIRGNTSIGDGCHIGNAVEIKNCVIGNNTNVGHLSYVGDSILGHGVNLGSGTTTSNFRHDGKTHRSMVGGDLVDTGRRKFGAVIADGVYTGINTSIYPGRKLGKCVTTLPGEVINSDK